MMHKGMCGRNENNGPASVAKVEPRKPLTVWAAENNTSFVLFASKEAADNFVSNAPPSAGLRVYPMPVVGGITEGV